MEQYEHQIVVLNSIILNKYVKCVHQGHLPSECRARGHAAPAVSALKVQTAVHVDSLVFVL